MRNVLIAGASSGIGEELAVQLAREKARLVLVARRAAELDRVAERCRQAGASMVEIAAGDLTSARDLETIAQRAESALGTIHLLVLAAGVSQRSLAVETSIEVDRRLMEINYFAPVALTKRLLPGMIAAGGGSLVILSSLVGKFGTPMRSGYAASKHAAHGFFDSLRAESHHQNIRVTIAVLGYIQTNITLHSLTGDGTPYGHVDNALKAGMPVEACASRILSSVRRAREEVPIGRGVEMLALPLERFAPRLLRRIVRGHTVS